MLEVPLSLSDAPDGLEHITDGLEVAEDLVFGGFHGGRETIVFVEAEAILDPSLILRDVLVERSLVGPKNEVRLIHGVIGREDKCVPHCQDAGPFEWSVGVGNRSAKAELRCFVCIALPARLERTGGVVAYQQQEISGRSTCSRASSTHASIQSSATLMSASTCGLHLGGWPGHMPKMVG